MSHLFKRVSIIFGIMILLTEAHLVSTNCKANAATKCSPCVSCQKPLAELKPMRLGGNIPSHFKKYETEFAVNFWSSWGWLYFKNKNPCADIYYLFEQDGGTSRHGVENGNAKYIIESSAIVSAEMGQTPVMHYSGWDGSEHTKKQPKLVPRLGRIEIHHDLIALKNGEKYDSGGEIYDWIQEPPDNEYYGYIGRENVNIDGRTYSGGDGLFLGEWNPGALAYAASADINFQRGDIGVTICKKETPSTCSLDIDDSVKNALTTQYLLYIENIKNQFNETMPNHVRIALKVKYGKLLGGDNIGEWKVYNTINGSIPNGVLYEPPACDKFKTDRLEIAGVCEFHDGPASAGETKIRKEIPNFQCSDLSVQINGILNWTGEDKDTKGTITSNFTISGTMTLHKQKHGGDYENYEIENLQTTYSHHAQFHRKKTSRECPETLILEVRGEGFAPVQKGSIVIRYPREKSGLHKQGELDLRLSSGPLPAQLKNCPEACRCQTRNQDIGISIEVVDQKTPIVKNQQEFSGSRSFGITGLRGAMNLISLGSLAWSFNDNESKDITTLPFVPKELEKVIAEKGGSITQMRNLGMGINKEGSNGRLTWKIRKIKKRD